MMGCEGHGLSLGACVDGGLLADKNEKYYVVKEYRALSLSYICSFKIISGSHIVAGHVS